MNWMREGEVAGAVATAWVRCVVRRGRDGEAACVRDAVQRRWGSSTVSVRGAVERARGGTAWEAGR